jgi:hypothetical protein
LVLGRPRIWDYWKRGWERESDVKIEEDNTLRTLSPYTPLKSARAGFGFRKEGRWKVRDGGGEVD